MGGCAWGGGNVKWNDTKNLQGFLCRNILSIAHGSGGTPRVTGNKEAQAPEHHSHGHVGHSTAWFILILTSDNLQLPWILHTTH